MIQLRNIVKIRCNEINHPDLFDFTATKFINGFKYNNLNYIEINSLKNVEILNSKENIIFIPSYAVNTHNEHFLEYLGKSLPECVFICFHFSFHPKILERMPFKKYILTGQHHIFKRDVYKFYLESYKDPRWIPFKFAADMDPNKVGTFKRADIFKSFFIGPTYADEYGMKFRSFMPQPSFLHNTFGVPIKEEDRIKVILSSRTCLGFHAKDNILDGNVTERVFEGLAYGNNVISDNPACSIATDGVCQYIESESYMIENIEKAWSDDSYFKEKQRIGYEFAKREGLYYHRAKDFLEKINYLYG